MMSFMKAVLATAALTLPLSAQAETKAHAPISQEERESFIAANVLWIFYHELAHALVDKMELPVLGKEEDAADQLAVLLSDTLWDGEHADIINSYASSAFWISGETAEEPMPWWDEHSTDQQRHFTIACLYYGGDPDNRKNVLKDVGLPAERAETCLIDREQMEHAWGGVLDRLAGKEFKEKMVFSDKSTDKKDNPTTKLVSNLLQEEVTSLNAEFSFPAKLTLSFAPCGEENAFYDPEKSELQICTEYLDFLDRLYAS